MNVSSELRRELERAAIGAQEAADREHAKLKELRRPGSSATAGEVKAQALRVQQVQTELDRCMLALFASEPSNSRPG